jgi:hypothetical protein
MPNSKSIECALLKELIDGHRRLVQTEMHRIAMEDEKAAAGFHFNPEIREACEIRLKSSELIIVNAQQTFDRIGC